MKKGIMIFGPAGSGKTTLGKIVAKQLEVPFVDTDDYIWRKDTEIPFSLLYPRDERISRLMEAIAETTQFVMAGSMDSFHEHFDPFFSLAVHLTAPAEVRTARVDRREYEAFGDRVLEGGDMYTAHRNFLDDVASYDHGGGSTSLAVHTKWAQSLPCPVLRLDGTDSLADNAKIIIKKNRALLTL